MDGSDVLSFIRKPDYYYSPKSVYDRLYLDFSKRTHESKISQSSSTSNLAKPHVIQKPEGRIEDSLMQKQEALKSKLKLLKSKYQAEEIKELQPAPSINPVSKILATQNDEKSRNMRSKYIISILSTSRFTKMARNATNRYIKSAEIDLGKLSGNKPPPKIEPKKEIPNLDKNFYLQQLRKVVNARPKIMEPEEPPTILEMSVVDRNQHWVKVKAKNLEKIKQSMIDKDLEGCTFTPILTPRMKLEKPSRYMQRESARSRSVNTSYSQLYFCKKQSNINSSKYSEKSSSPSPRRRYKEIQNQSSGSTALYSPLAPTSQKFSFRAGMDVKKFIDVAQKGSRYESTKNFS